MLGDKIDCERCLNVTLYKLLLQILNNDIIRVVPIVSVSAVSAFFGGIGIGKSEAIFADTTDTCSDENYC